MWLPYDYGGSRIREGWASDNISTMAFEAADKLKAIPAVMRSVREHRRSVSRWSGGETRGGADGTNPPSGWWSKFKNSTHEAPQLCIAELRGSFVDAFLGLPHCRGSPESWTSDCSGRVRNGKVPYSSALGRVQRDSIAASMRHSASWNRRCPPTPD